MYSVRRYDARFVQGNDGRMRATAERKANMKSGTTASPSQGAREIAKKLATYPSGEVEPFFTRRMLIGDAANLIDAELAGLRNYLEHRDYCAYYDIQTGSQGAHGNNCTCGLAALLERFTPGGKG